MKKIPLILFLLFLPAIIYSQNVWGVINSNVGNSLKKVYFIDTLNGWTVGDTGLILKTSNGGLNWIKQNSKTDFSLHDVFFVNINTGWALGWNIFNPTPPYGTLVLHTTTGGVLWDTATFPIENVFIRKLVFVNPSTGYAGGSGINFFKTTNGGLNWFQPQIDTLIGSGLPVTGFKFFNDNYGYAFGGAMDIAGIVWKTTNGGNFWQSKIVSPEPIFGIHYFDSLKILGIGGDFEYGPGVISTKNGGTSWEYVSLNLFGMPVCLSFRTENEGWSSLAFAQQFIYTTDKGENWITVSTPDSIVINDILFIDSTHGVAVGENGRILKFNPGVVSINSNSNALPQNFHLNQNYPNPFNPYTVISYELKTSSYVILKIFDISGKELKTIYQGALYPGKYNLKFDATGYSSGTYFYEISVRDLSGKDNYFRKETKKMVIIK